jgi:amidase
MNSDEALGGRADSRCHAFGDDALGDLDAVGLVEKLQAGEVSSSELVEAAIARTKAVNPKLNGLAYEAFDRARARAASRQPYGGYFDGVPSFIKDNVAVEGMPTMQGTDAWDPRPMPADGAWARAFLSTGLIPLGKTQMSEFGFSGSAEHPRIGPVRNPWNPDYTAGASSSGSAAFVAAGVVPIAHANDGGGSIRIPAACNGLVGLKPSRGRLPLDKEAARMPLHLVANGVVTRSVRDTAAFMREAERVYRDPKLPAIGDVTRPGSQRLQIAVCTKSILREASPEMRELTLKTAALLEELGHKVTEIDNPVPDRFKDDFPRVLVVPGLRGGAGRTPHVRPELRPHPIGHPDARARPQCGARPAQGPAGHRAAAGVAPDHAKTVGYVRRCADADAQRGNPTNRPPRPDGRLRPGDGPTP